MKIIIAFAVLLITLNSFCQEKITLYHPEANAQKQIDSSIAVAKKQHKFVLIMGGGNWCTWCIKFEKFCKEDKKLDSFINKNFVWIHLNWSKENENKPIYKKLGYPQRFGFPVFVILDSLGNRLHTQNSEYLEKGGSYDKFKVFAFFEMWSPWGLNPKMYGD